MEVRVCTKVGYPGDVVTQKQGLATFGTRELACTTRASDFLRYGGDPHRNQIFLEGRRQGERRFSPGLHCTSQVSQQSVQGYCIQIYVHWNSFIAARRALERT